MSRRTHSVRPRHVSLASMAVLLLPFVLGACDEAGQDALGEPITEEAFKALHVLSEDAVPDLRGHDLTLGGARGYLSLPEGGGPHPGVLVIHEWWGLNDHIRHWADRLAADGYAALAVDLYDGRVAESPDSALVYMQSVDETVAAGVLAAGVTFLREDPRIRAPRVASIGWCFGGGWSLRAALENAGCESAVVYYGQLATDAERLGTSGISVCGIFASRDGWITPESVNAFEDACSRAGIPYEIHRYDADHAFANPSSARYDFESAGDAWSRVRAFLDRHVRSAG